MKLDNAGISFLKSREGLELNAYNKDGKWTIGYGNTYYENGQLVKQYDTISATRAESLFRMILKEYENTVNQSVTGRLNQSQYNSLVSIAYNIGPSAFKKSTLLKKVNANPNDSTIATEFRKWVNSQGKVLNGLVKRRELEIKLYFSNSPEESSLNWLFWLVVGWVILSNRKRILEILK